MANHLFIGLGGTGGKVLRELRKRVYEEFKSNEPTRGNAHIDYIYVDSSEDDLNDRTGWKVLGKSVHLADTQKVSIHGINLSMLDNINMYPGIKAFLDSKDVAFMKQKMGPLIEQGIGGQRRRLGRTLLANNLASNDLNNDFNSRLRQTVKRLTDSSGEQAVTFHVCAGLAGGTGSGTIVDVVSQIRKEYPPSQGSIKYKVHLYLYIPEMNVVNSNHDEGYYQANGYAALLELNAMSVNRYHPIDITGEKDIYSGEVKRLLQDIEPFEAAFVYSNVNEAGKLLDLGIGLPKAVADFLFQHTIASEIIGSAGQMGRLIGCENDGAGPENDKANQPTRSRKFLSFGIKRIEYPETEIKEYVTYSFVQQAVRQLEYNKWDGGLGFVDITSDEIGTGFASEIKEKSNRERLLLSNNYLMLSKAIIDNKESKRWKDIVSTWEDRTQEFADDVQIDDEKESWLAAFNTKCEEYFQKNYRSHGVKGFYDVQRSERVNYARHIRKHIERLLFDEWSNAQKSERSKSILEVEAYLSLLIKDCGERIEAFQKQTEALSHEVDDVNNKIRDINDDWSRIKWAFDPITKSSRTILGKYKKEKCDYYSLVTRAEGYRYAIELLQDVIRELSMAKDGVSAFKARLMNILQEVKKQIDSRCRKDSITDGGMMEKKYNPELVQKLVRSYVATEEMQRDNTQNILNLLISSLGDDNERSFSNLCDKTDEQSIVDTMLDVCEKRAIAEMENSAKRDAVYKMVSVNILEKLKQELSGEGKLEDFVRKIKESAKTFVQYNAQEQGKAQLSNSGGGMKSMLQLCIPKYEGDTTGFRDKLIKEFALQAGIDPKQDVAENYKDNQIVVIAASSGFPVRYLSNLTIMKQKYDELLAKPDSELNRMMLHTESFQEELPSLYELDTKSLKAMLVKPVMLTYAMGLIQEKEDPITQQKFDAINLPDPELSLLGVENWVQLGSNILDTIDMLSENYELAKKLMEKEKENLSTYRSIDQKMGLKKSLGDVLAKIKACPACENNQYNPTYIKYQGIAVELLKGIG